MSNPVGGGVYAAMLTPYGRDGQVDTGTVSKLAGFLATEGLHGLCPAGTTGEFPLLSGDEKVAINRAACGAGIPVVAGVWGANRDERTVLAASAREAGASAVFLTTPFFFPASAEAIVDWYRGVHAASSLPLFAYSIPQYTHNPIPLEALETLAGEGTIQGYKDSSGDLAFLKKVVARLRGKILIFAGNETIFPDARTAGVDGFISGVAGLFPRTVLGVWQGDAGALKRLASIRQALKSAGTIPGLKYLASKRRLDCGEPREPLHRPGPDACTELDRALLESGETGPI